MSNIFDVNIKFKNSSPTSYIIEPNTTILGRQFSNNSTRINVTKPDEELNNICVMYVLLRNEDRLLDFFFIENEPILITNNITKETSVRLVFKFYNPISDYVKWSNPSIFNIIQGVNTDNIPLEPPQYQQSFLRLFGKAFTFSEFDDTNKTLIFKNIDGDIVSMVDLKIGGGNGDMLKSIYDTKNKETDVFEYANELVKKINITFDTI